jgi:hypothetical protein
MVNSPERILWRFVISAAEGWLVGGSGRSCSSVGSWILGKSGGEGRLTWTLWRNSWVPEDARSNAICRALR